MEKKVKSAKRWKKWLRKYRVVLLDETSFEERFSLVLSRFNVFLVVGTTSVILVVSTILIIAYTPLREYVPGYMSTRLRRDAIKLDQQTDSLMAQVAYQEAFVRRIQSVIIGDTPSDSLGLSVAPVGWTPEKLNPSARELALRDHVAELDEAQREATRSENNLAKPIEGTMIASQRLSRREYGIKISGNEDDVVRVMKSGTVLSIEGTPSLGFVVSLQHAGGGMSRYGNLARVSVRVGDFLKQSDALGSLGSTSLNETPYVHLQYWLEGESLNLEKLLGY